MSIGQIIDSFKKSSDVFHRYYFLPTQLVGKNSTLKDAFSFAVVLTGFFISLPFLTFWSDVSVSGKAISDQTASKLLFELVMLINITLISIFIGVIQIVIARIRRVKVKARVYIISIFYCVSIFVLVFFVSFYVLGLLRQVGAISWQMFVFVYLFAFIASWLHMIFVNVISAADRKSVGLFWFGWAVAAVVVAAFAGIDFWREFALAFGNLR